MKLLYVLSFALSALAMPEVFLDKRGYQRVNLVFHGGPAQYTMNIPADGKKYKTNNALSISIIDMPDFFPRGCTFYTPHEQTLVTSYDTKTGLQSVIVGAPQPVTAVKCSGTCITNYSDCYRNGSPLPGGCCAGFCAANKCRPFISYN